MDLNVKCVFLFLTLTKDIQYMHVHIQYIYIIYMHVHIQYIYIYIYIYACAYTLHIQSYNIPSASFFNLFLTYFVSIYFVLNVCEVS